MNDDELVGVWDSGPFDAGAMESSRLVLRADGSGWAVWDSAGGGMELTWLSWSRTAADRFRITGQRLISGTWEPGRPDGIVAEGEPADLDDEEFRYGIAEAGSVRALVLGSPFGFAERFGYAGRDATPPVLRRHAR